MMDNRRKGSLRLCSRTVVSMIICMALCAIAVVMLGACEGASPKTISSQEDFATLEKDDLVVLGEYEQDGLISNGKEPLEWIVIAKTDEEVLLISKHVLDVRRFSMLYNEWETSELKSWLDGEFIEEAGLQDFVITMGCLSEQGARIVFGDEGGALATPTKYAVMKGALENQRTGGSVYWLCSPARYHDYAMTVSGEGTISLQGESASAEYVGVRPTIYVVLP